MTDREVFRKARRVVALAKARGATLATAESCTGGLVAAALTAVDGSSAVLDRGFVTYSNAAKTEMLGVDADVIGRHGAVSEPVARQMAEGARRQAGVSLAVAITGIAGPGGGSAEKPVGLVHFGAAGAHGSEHRVERFGDLGREEVRRRAVLVALEMLEAALERPTPA